MAKVFKNEKELEKFLLEKSRLALMKAQDKVYAIIKKFLDQFYNEYDPSKSKYGYERTYQFLNSLVKSQIVRDGKGYKAEVYFDLNYIYETGANPSGEDVMKAAEWGRHGAMGLMVADFKGTAIWHESLGELNAKAIDILVNMLKAEGIPIKK